MKYIPMIPDHKPYAVTRVESVEPSKLWGKTDASKKFVYSITVKNNRNFVCGNTLTHNSHHMPSDYFVHLSKIKCHYILGLTATPQREDGREDYIVALTGQPVGLSWDYFRKYGFIQSPESHIWIVKNDAERIERLRRIINQDTLITLVFSDSLKMGEAISKELGIEFVSGETKDKLKKLRENLATKGIVAASRIADEGVSLKNIQRVIEVSWLFGSRHQELQRMTRLLHAADKKSPGIHHVIMTPEEWNRDHKRFWSSMDRGFKIVLHREGFDEKVFDSSQQREHIKRAKTRRSNSRQSEVNDDGTVTPKNTKKKKAHEPNDFEMSHAILSLPGIQKKLSGLTKAERLSIRVMYQEPQKDFSKEDVWNKVGLGRPRDFASFTKLIELKLIKEVKPGKYQAI